MTRYDEIRLVFNTDSYKNKDLSIQVKERNNFAAVELIEKNSEAPLEAQFVPRLVDAQLHYSQL